MVTGGATAEAVRSLSKAEETEVWAQDRVSVSRAAVTKHCKLGDKTTEVYLFPVLEAIDPRSRCRQGHAVSEGSRGESFLPAGGIHGSFLCSLASSCSTVVSASDVTAESSPILKEQNQRKWS